MSAHSCKAFLIATHRLAYIILLLQNLWKDPLCWAQGTAYCRLQRASSGPIRWLNPLIQGDRWWWQLDLWLRPWGKATVMLMKNPRPLRPKGITSEEQSQMHASYFFFAAVKNVCNEFIPQNYTNNSVFYFDFCDGSMKKYRNDGPNFGNNWIDNHDNVSCYTSLFSRTFLTKNKMTDGPHLPYSSDLVPKLKSQLKGYWLNTIEMIQEGTLDILKNTASPMYPPSCRKLCTLAHQTC